MGGYNHRQVIIATQQSIDFNVQQLVTNSSSPLFLLHAPLLRRWFLLGFPLHCTFFAVSLCALHYLTSCKHHFLQLAQLVCEVGYRVTVGSYVINYGRLRLHSRFHTRVNCCYSKLIGYTKGAVTFKEAVIYQILRYEACKTMVHISLQRLGR